MACHQRVSVALASCMYISFTIMCIAAAITIGIKAANELQHIRDERFAATV